MATKTSTQVLDIDIKGYRQTLQNKGKPRILIEGLSNAFDTKSDVVIVTFSQESGWATLTVQDNDPDGFKSLKDAWTLFAASERREDPELRGRFGQGEKELIAIAVDGGMLEIVSTTGTVTFTKEGRKQAPTRIPLGTTLFVRLKLNQGEAAEFEGLVRDILVPDGVTFKFNDALIEHRKPVRTAREQLDTVIWDAEGNMRESRRVTEIELHEADDVAYIYELGIPVVEHDGRFHINVMQKVPLNANRDNVKPAYLKKLRRIMLDSTYDLLTADDSKSTWVKDVVASASNEAFDAVMVNTYGKDAVIRDNFNPEANKRATDDGRELVAGRSLDKDVWERMRERKTFLPAGQVFQTSVPTSPDGIPPIPYEQWTDAMRGVAAYVQALGEHALGFKPTVAFAPTTVGTGQKRSSASWGGRTMTFYLRNVGRNWPTTVDQESLDAIIIHELTHHTQEDHFTDGFIRDIASIGARLRSCPVRLHDYRA